MRVGCWQSSWAAQGPVEVLEVRGRTSPRNARPSGHARGSRDAQARATPGPVDNMLKVRGTHKPSQRPAQWPPEPLAGRKASIATDTDRAAATVGRCVR